jgi:hypothetical protein
LGEVSSEVLDGEAQLRRGRHRAGIREHLQQAEQLVRLDTLEDVPDALTLIYEAVSAAGTGSGPAMIAYRVEPATLRV